MTIFEDTTFLDMTESRIDNFRTFDGAQSYEDYDEATTVESDEDMVSLFRSYDGRY